jgi:pimeloyl-ACP methyl ester carboxylesterase
VLDQLSRFVDVELHPQHRDPHRDHYAEARAEREPVVSTGRLGVAVFKDDFQTIRSLAERDNANIQHWSEFDRGGHFAVLENPEAIVADLRAFFATAS